MISGWAFGTHQPRLSHDHDPADLKNADDDAEPRPRSSSDATPRPTPAPNPKFLATASTQDTAHNVLASSSVSDVFSSSKRLGFFHDKFSSASHSGGKGAQLLHPRSHSRADSALPASRDSNASPVPSSTTAPPSTLTNTSKAHTSPSKASYGRTYDSKLVSREMHRLGNLAHLPAALAPALATSPSAATLTLPTAGSSTSMSASSSNDPWGALHVHVLPLFNGEPLRIPIEDLNVLVKRHIQAVVSSSPSKALATLENDAAELIASGMVTLNAKLTGIEDDKLVSRVVEIWGFFWDQVLTYVEGVLLPFQSDALLSSLYRTPKTHRSSSPSRQNAKSSLSSNMGSSLQMSSYHIDVRTVALRSFRDKVILPLASRLYPLLLASKRQEGLLETSAYQQPRLQQMLLVLVSQSRQRPPTFSLTAPPPQLTAGEAAVSELLRVVHDSRPQTLRAQNAKTLTSQTVHAPTFLSGGQPRDRRGRIAHKQKLKGSPRGDDGEDHGTFGDGAETPRNGLAGVLERDREREFLEALRSPDPESTASRASIGGWGLGGGHVDSGKAEEDEEDEVTDWDQAQADVERMLGMKPAESPGETKRRLT